MFYHTILQPRSQTFLMLHPKSDFGHKKSLDKQGINLKLVEVIGFEPMTFAMPLQRSTN